MTSQMFLVRGYDQYEAPEAIKIFCKEDNANAFCKACIDYKSQYESVPDLDDDYDSVWVPYLNKKDEISNKHPAGKQFAELWTYDVIPVELGD